MPRPRSRTTTLRDVARRAGVSMATASKALNGRDEVAPATRRRVLQAADDLAFLPATLLEETAAPQLRTVGLLCEVLAARFAMPILLGIESALGAEQVCVLLCDARGDVARRQHYIRTMLARKVDGFIVLGVSNDLRPSLTRDIRVPVVYAYCESEDPRDLSMISDDAAGARLAVEHLIALGRRRIAHLTGPESFRASRRRAAGAAEVLEHAGLPLLGGVQHGEWSQRWGRRGTFALISAHPDIDAIFCGNDQIAVGAAEAVHSLGRHVPDDIALVGYDNWDIFSDDCRPPLTTIDLDLERLGAAAVKRLFDALDGRGAPGVVAHPCRLVVRESSGRVVSPPHAGLDPAPTAAPAPTTPPASASGSGTGPVTGQRSRS